jgi:energy-coupling factor transporter ATP-binding protein EcfA2
MADKPTPPLPAYFLSLSLENVRSFGEKQTISFARADGRPAQWTIILGDNGVGKTTVLKSLAMISPVPIPIGDASNKAVRYEPRFLEQLRKAWLPNRGTGESSGFISVKYALIKEKLQYANPSFTAQENLLSFDFEANGQYSSGGGHTFNQEEAGLTPYGYGAGRTTGNSTLSEAPETADTCASLFDDRADLLNPEEWFLNIDYGSKLAGAANTQLADARNRVEKMLIDVLPGVTEIRIAAAGTPQKPQISLQFLLHGTWVRLRDMSLGYQTLVVWLTDLASKLYIRYPDSPNPLAEPAIVLIDEIDLHLHPKWQRELLSMLGSIFPETQFIATAHSPLVVLAAGDEQANVVLLRREGDETKVYENPVDVRGWRVDQILTSIFFNLETARSIETEKKITRQANLLNKEKLSAKERRELDALTLELEGQPMGSVDGEAEEAEILRELLARLNQAPS